MLEKLIRDINKCSKTNVVVGLITHKVPDYDAVASTLSLATYLSFAANGTVRIVPVTEKNSFLFNSSLSFVSDVVDHFDYVVALDVNEEDRVYGLEHFYNVDKSRRYLFDHHTGNRVPLNVDETNCLVEDTASSTCEIIGREILKRGTLSENISSMLYHGIVSDTVGFKRQTTNRTLELCNKLNLSEEKKKEIFAKVTGLSDEQRKILGEISRLNFSLPGLTLYSLRKDESFLEKMNLLKHEKIDEKLIPEEGMSILIIDCGSSVHLKIRKSKDSKIDIVKFAEKCNGGGHSNRTSGRFYGMSYEDVLLYVISLYESMILNHEDCRKVLRKEIDC